MIMQRIEIDFARYSNLAREVYSGIYASVWCMDCYAKVHDCSADEMRFDLIMQRIGTHEEAEHGS